MILLSGASKQTSSVMGSLPRGAAGVRPRSGCESFNLRWTHDSYTGVIPEEAP